MSVKFALPFSISAVGRTATTDDVAKQLADDIVAVVGTNPEERLMRPGYGVDLQGLLFQPLDHAAFDRLVVEVRRAIGNFVPQVRLVQVEPVLDRDNGVLGVTVHFAFATASNTVEQTYAATVLPGGSVVER